MLNVLQGFNADLFYAIYGAAMSNPFASSVAIFFATWFPYLVIGSVVVYEFYIQENSKEIRRALLRVAFPSILTWLLVMVIKHYFPMARPFADGSDIIPLITVSDPFGSFPSSHAAIFGSLVGTMIVNRSKSWRWYLGAAILISLARVAVGVHWPFDVFCGLILGILLGFLGERIFFRQGIASGPH